MCNKFADRFKRQTRAVGPLLAAALLGVGGSLVPVARGGSVTSTWLNDVSGSWTNAAEWSSNPNDPNNVSSTSYDAIIGATGSSAYQVGLGSNITINSLTISSANATLNQSAGTFQAGTVSLNAGAYILSGGTIASTNLKISGGSFAAENGTLNGISVTGGDLQVGASGSIAIQNGVTIANTNLDLGDSANLFFGGPGQTINNLNLTTSSSASVFTSGPTSSGDQTLTLGANVTVHDGVSFVDNFAGDTLINDGVITADNDNGDYNGVTIATDNFTNNGTLEASNGSALHVSAGTWTNNGTILSGDGSTVALQGNWTNAGTISGPGEIFLGGAFTTAAIGKIVATGASVNITGSLDNTNATLDPNNYGGSLTLNSDPYLLGTSGTITNGIINVDNTASSQNFVVEYGELDNTRITGGDLYVAPEGSLLVNHNFLIDSHNLILQGSSLIFDGDSRTVDNLNITSGGQSQIMIGGPNSTGPVTITLGGSVDIHDGVTFSDYVAGGGGDDLAAGGGIKPADTTSGNTLINNGLINADATSSGININVSNFTNNTIAESTNGGVLTIDYDVAGGTWNNAGTLSCGGPYGILSLGGTWSNAGTISASDSTCEIDLGGNFTTADIGALITNGAYINIAGTLDNTNATLNPGNYGGSWVLDGVAINGGTLNTSGGNFAAESGILNGVHVTGGDLEIGADGQVQIQNGITIDNHNLIIDSGAELLFDGPGQRIDNLNIVPAGYAYLYSSGFDSNGPQTLTLGSHVTVHDGVAFRSHQVGDGLINDGTLVADNSVKIGIDVSVDNFTNNGLAEATNGGTLTIEPATSFTNTGILAVQNGTIQAPHGISLGTGKLSGSGAVVGSVTVSSGSTISPGTSTVLGTGASNSIGSLSTGGSTWNGGGTYFWKIARPGTGNVSAGSGGSGSINAGSGVEGTDWDQLLVSSLSIASGGSNPSFTLALNNTAPISTASSRYSWVIAQTGSTSLPTFAGATHAYTAGTNLLLYSPTGSGNDAVILDSSGYTINGKTAPLSSGFSLEFEPVAADGGDYGLILDETVPTPEPATGFLTLGALMLVARRRRAR